MDKITDKKYFARGKRGIIHTARLKNKKVAIKTKNPDSDAVDRIKNEGYYLKILKKHNIGPRLVKAAKNRIIYEFVEGDFILDYIGKNGKDQVKRVLKDLLRQAFTLDKLEINKEEMHRQNKHIIIKEKPVMIDFERAHYSRNPNNVTQLCQFMIRISGLLRKKGIYIEREKIIDLAKAYKKKRTRKNLENIVKYVTK